jgi:membrane protease YdiL (CAAX protease family)
MGSSMAGTGIVAGLAESAFIADLDGRDRAPAPIAATLVVGPLAALVASIAAMIFVLTTYTVVSGHGREGLDGLKRVLFALKDAGPPTLGSETLGLFLDASVNGAIALTFVAVAAAFVRRPLHSYLTAAPQVRWRLLLIGLALGAAALAPVLVLDRVSSGADSPPPLTSLSPDLMGRLAYAATSLLFIPAAAAEEIFFRGWCLRQIAAFSRSPVFTLVGTALAFSILHFDFNPDGLLTRALMGAGFAYMTLRLGGIEFSTGVHATNNILIILFVAPLSLQLPEKETGITGASLLVDAAMIAGYVAITEITARSASLRLWAGVRGNELSPSSPLGRVDGSSSPFD